MNKRLEEWFRSIRATIMAYDVGGVSHQAHLEIVDTLEEQFHAVLHGADPFRRRVARSFVQYLAQRQMRPRKNIVLAELASYALLPGLSIYLLINGLVNKPTPHPRVAGRFWLISRLRYDVTPEIFHTPHELSAESAPIAYTPLRYLRYADIRFLVRVYLQQMRLQKMPHGQWYLKIAKDIAWARATIEQFPCVYALMTDECNCSLSVLTSYANQHGTSLYVVQHGDLFLSAYTAFFEANRSYCWAEFYVDILKRLHARSDFRIYTNPAYVLSQEEKAIPAAGIGIFHPSFYSLTTAAERSAFAAAVRALAEHYPVRVRPHPAYFSEYEAMAEAYGPHVTLAPASEETSKQFALRHALIIGTTSAALLESLMLGRQVISIAGALVNNVAEYHFAYRMPNCTLSSIEELEQAAHRLMASPSH